MQNSKQGEEEGEKKDQGVCFVCGNKRCVCCSKSKESQTTVGVDL